MKITQVHITIGQFDFDYVHEIDIVSGWESLTDTAEIQLPANLKYDKNKLKELIKKDNKVSISYGYEPNVYPVFEGFVSAVKPSVPVVIECEDLMWKLKQIQLNDVAKNETIKSFLDRNLPDFEIDAFEVELPRFIASKVSASKVLEQIKSDFGLRSFVRDGKVTVGKQYDPEYAEEKFVVLNETVKDDNLEYKSKDDVKIKITAISNMSNGEKHEIEIGDEGGDSKTLNFYNIPVSELQKLAEKEAERLIYDGFRGSLELFGEPFVRQGDVLTIQDNEDSDKVGSYWIDQVTYKIGVGGYSQGIKLGAQT